MAAAAARPSAAARRAAHTDSGEPAPAPLVNLLHDTAFRRVRDSAATVAHRLDESVYRMAHAQRRILFEAASPMSLSVFRPVYDRLVGDPRLEFWFTTADASWEAAAIFGAAGVKGRVISAEQARWMKFDAYVNTDFWNTTWLQRRTRRVHLFHGVAGNRRAGRPGRHRPRCGASTA